MIIRSIARAQGRYRLEPDMTASRAQVSPKYKTPAPPPSLSLSDVLSHYHSLTDTTHKLWAYFQAVAIGSALFAWSLDGHTKPSVFAALAIAFFGFSLMNLRLVISSQKDLVVVADSIHRYAKTPKLHIHSAFFPLIHRIRPDPVQTVTLWHILVTLATLASIWWRYEFVVV